MQGINTFSKGMQGGIDNSLFSQQAYTYMLNGYMVSKDEHGFVVTNIKGTESIANFNPNEVPIGVVLFNEVLYILTHFDDNQIESNRLYSYKGSDKTKWVDSMQLVPCGPQNEGFDCPIDILGYTRERFVEIIAKEDYDESVNLYLCDGLNNNTIINSGLNRNGVITGKYYPVYSRLFFAQQGQTTIPGSITHTVEDYGKIKVGAYFVYVKYVDKQLNETPFMREYGPIYIYADNGIESHGTDDIDAFVAKSINLKLIDLNESFTYVKIAVERITGSNGGVIKTISALSKLYRINDSSANIIFDYDSPTSILTFEQLLNDNIRETKCLTETQLDGRFFGANWSNSIKNESLVLKLASYIVPFAGPLDDNLIKNDNDIFITSPSNSDFTQANMSYMPQEIYPLGIVFLIDGIFKTDVYPICGWYDGVTESLVNNRPYTSMNPILNSEYEDLRLTLESMSEQERYDEIDRINNGKGLFMIPDTTVSMDGINNEYKPIGLGFMFDSALSFLEANKRELPNITGAYIVQGERKINIITQGLMVATVENVGFYSTYKDQDQVAKNVIQTTNLGSNETPMAFPWLDDSVCRRFPVFSLFSYNTWTANTVQAWGWAYHEEVSDSYLYVYDGDYEHSAQEDPSKQFLSNTLNNPRVLSDYAPTHQTAGWPDMNYPYNLKTKRFGVYTPDIMQNANIEIGGHYYIRSKGIFQVKTNILKDPYFATQIRDGKPFDLVGEESTRIYIGDSRDDDRLQLLNETTTRPNQLREITSSAKRKAYHKANCQIVPGWTVDTGFNNFTSKMKSIVGLWGWDLDINHLINNAGNPTSVNYFFGASREDLRNSGILFNRRALNSFQTGNLNTGYALEMPNPVANIYGPYGTLWMNRNHDNPDGLLESVNHVFSSRGLSSIPYIAVEFEVDKYYQYGNADMEFQNAVVDICKYENLQEYINKVSNDFRLEDEIYSSVLTLNNGLINSQEVVRRGDIYAQKTYMRLCRWDENIGEGKNAEYTWKTARAMNIFLQSRVNSYLRRINTTDTYAPYCLSQSEDLNKENKWIWKDSVPETFESNTAYETMMSDMVFKGFDSLLLNKSTRNTNRVRYSTKHLSGAFIDAYKEMPDDQFRDMALDNGPIQNIIEISSTLFLVHENGINQIQQGKPMEISDSSSIVVGEKEILSDSYLNLASYGTQHKQSVVKGEGGFYGVDWNKKKLWRAKGQTRSNGKAFFEVEDLLESKQYYNGLDLIKELFLNNGGSDFKGLKQDIYGELTGIISGYDIDKKQIFFTFKLGNELYRTLIFSEEYDAFIGFQSVPASMYMNSGNKLFSYSYQFTDLWKHNVGDYQKIYGVTEPFELELIFNGVSEKNNAGEFEKEFLSHLLSSCPEILDKVEWSTEYQNSIKFPFLDETKFWEDPEYREHTWRVPILPNQKTQGEEVGPEQTVNPSIKTTPALNEFNVFADESNLRGQWLKIKIRYVGIDNSGTISANLFYLKNIITNFIISYSS